MLTFSFINVPVLVKENRALWTFGASTVSLMLLYAAGAFIHTGIGLLWAGAWNASWEAIVFLPFVLRSDVFEKYAEKLQGAYLHGSGFCADLCLRYLWYAEIR